MRMGKRFRDENQEDLFSFGAPILDVAQEPSLDEVKTSLSCILSRWLSSLKTNTAIVITPKEGSETPKGSFAIVPLQSKTIYRAQIKKTLLERKKIDEIKARIQDFLTQDLPSFEKWVNKSFSVEKKLMETLSQEYRKLLERQAQVEFKEPPESNPYMNWNDFEADQETLELFKFTVKFLKEHLSIEDLKKLKDISSRAQSLDNLMSEIANDRVVGNGFWELHLTQKVAEFIDTETKIRARELKTCSWEQELKLKTLYKKLAVKLHPDRACGKVDSLKNYLWLKLDAAYQEQNWESLQAVETEYHLHFEPDSGKISLSEILAISKGQKEELKALRKEFKNIQKNIEYGFSSLSKDEIRTLKTQIKEKMRSEISTIKREIKQAKQFT